MKRRTTGTKALRYVRFAVLGVLALCAPVYSAQAPGAWVELRSPNFVVVSNAGEERARRVAQDFERVRAVVQRALPQMRVDPRQPIAILAVKDEQSLRELLPQFWERNGPRPTGVFRRGPHVHHIAIRVDTSRGERYRRVFHEYFHLLTSLNLPWVPPWLDEGLSEFWENTVVRDNTVETGRPARHHLQFLKAAAMLPLQELFAMDRNPHETDPDKTFIFYAQSWALTHYLIVGDASGDARRSLPVYLNLLEREIEPLEAAELAFGDLERVGGALKEYVRADKLRSLRVDVAARSDDETVRVRALLPAESLAVRGNFLVHGERPLAAEPLLVKALELDPNQSLAHESMGYLHFRQNEHAAAATWFRQAVALDSSSYLPHYYSAILTRATGGADASARTERHLRRAVELNPMFAPAYARLADHCAQDETRLEEAVSLAEKTIELEPDNPGYWVDLGYLLLKVDRPRDARAAGGRALAVARESRTRKLAASLLQSVEHYERHPATREDGKG